MFERDNYKEAITDVCRTFALGKAEHIWPLGGTATVKFAVETTQGRFVVRIRPVEFAKEKLVSFDHQVLWRLHNAGLPIPCPQKTNDGKSWIDMGNRMIEVLSWVEGSFFQWEDQKSLENTGLFLAEFHSLLSEDIPDGKEGVLREDHPCLIRSYVIGLKNLCQNPSQKEQLNEISKLINLVEEKLDKELYPKLPKTIIHGDLHPGNVKFNNSKVSAVYDFDYLSLQARARDISDAIMFFAANRKQPFETDDITFLTQTFECDFQRSLIILKGYREISSIEKIEMLADNIIQIPAIYF